MSACSRDRNLQAQDGREIGPTNPARLGLVAADIHDDPDSPCGQAVDEGQGKVGDAGAAVALYSASPSAGHVRREGR